MYIWLSVGVCADKDITGIKKHEAERHSKSQAGWMIMFLACSLYIVHNINVGLALPGNRENHTSLM